MCAKCADLRPFRGFQSFQEYLGECWASDKSAVIPEKAASVAVGKNSNGVKKKTSENGGPEVANPDENETAQQDARGVQDGGTQEDGEGVDKLQNLDKDGAPEPKLVITHEERASSNGSDQDGDQSDADEIFAGTRGKKVFQMIRNFESEQAYQFDSFKREIHQELKDTLVAINESITRFTGSTDKSTLPLSEGVDVGEDSDNTYIHDNDNYSIDNDSMSDRPTQFEERIRNIEKPSTTTKVADKQQEIVVENGSKTIKLALNLNLNDEGRREKEKKKEEDNFDRNSIPLKKVVQSCVPTSAYRGFFCDEAVIDLKKKKEDISSAASSWAAGCFDERVPERKKFHEGMWAFIAAADKEVYDKAMVPGVVESSTEGTSKTSMRFPRFPVRDDDSRKWEELVNEVLMSKKDNNQLPSVLASSVNKNYQFVDKDFQHLAMQPEIDLYVEEQCSYAGKKVPQLEKNSLAFRTTEGTKLQHRIIVFMRAALASMKQNCCQGSGQEEKEKGDFLNMAIVALEQATCDLRTVTARLHANGLKAVRRQVLEKTELGTSDKEFLIKAKAVPAKALFANRAPGFSEELKKEEQLKEARVAVSRAEKRKRESQSYSQNQKKPRFDDFRRDSSRGRDRGNFFNSRDRSRQPFRDYNNRPRGENKPAARGGRGGNRGGRSWNGGQGFSGRKK